MKGHFHLRADPYTDQLHFCNLHEDMSSLGSMSDATIYVIITGSINLFAYAVLTHHYLKLKYLCDKFIED